MKISTIDRLSRWLMKILIGSAVVAEAGLIFGSLVTPM